MTFTTVAELRTALIDYATTRGLSTTKSVTLVITDAVTNFEPVRFVVSYTEPSETVMPLNLLWVVTNPQSANFNKLLRRTNRIPANGYNHTWAEVTAVETVWSNQVWDMQQPENQALLDHANSAGNPHGTKAEDVGALSLTGGTLTGPTHARTLDTGEEPAPTEIVPRSWIDALVAPIRMVGQQNNTFMRNLNTQFMSLRNRVVVLEQAILGSRVFVQDILEPSDTWNITHNFNKPNVFVTVYDNDNNQVIPGSVVLTGLNTLVVLFAAPVSGRVEVGRY